MKLNIFGWVAAVAFATPAASQSVWPDLFGEVSVRNLSFDQFSGERRTQRLEGRLAYDITDRYGVQIEAGYHFGGEFAVPSLAINPYMRFGNGLTVGLFYEHSEALLNGTNLNAGISQTGINATYEANARNRVYGSYAKQRFEAVDGSAVILGLEHDFNDMLSGYVDYQYINFPGSLDDLEIQSLRAGINYLIGGSGSWPQMEISASYEVIDDPEYDNAFELKLTIPFGRDARRRGQNIPEIPRYSIIDSVFAF